MWVHCMIFLNRTFIHIVDLIFLTLRLSYDILYILSEPFKYLNTFEHIGVNVYSNVLNFPKYFA